jgi:hypothetical protein
MSFKVDNCPFQNVLIRPLDKSGVLKKENDFSSYLKEIAKAQQVLKMLPIVETDYSKEKDVLLQKNYAKLDTVLDDVLFSKPWIKV